MEEMKKPLIPKDSFGKRRVFICGLMTLLVFLAGTLHHFQQAIPTQVFLPASADGNESNPAACIKHTYTTCMVWGCDDGMDCHDNFCKCQAGHCSGPDGKCRAGTNRWLMGNVTISGGQDLSPDMFWSAEINDDSTDVLGSNLKLALSNGSGLESRWSVWAFRHFEQKYIFVPEKFPDYILWGQADGVYNPLAIAKQVAEAGGGNAGLVQKDDLIGTDPEVLAFTLSGDQCMTAGLECAITGDLQDSHGVCTMAWNPEPVVGGLTCPLVKAPIVTWQWTVRPPPGLWAPF